ncbi:MAG: putative toxin-antitoxin system toxin component, PIN family [Candidatus Poribacteria bacterium]|nr:putative toxin-antitoxin system toxin component, PIN family [Candidatus Poribacteria bacterium]
MNEPENRWRICWATFDTNIFVRTVIRKDNLPNHLLSLWREKRFVLVLSQPIIDEVEKVLLRRKLRRKYQYTLTEVSNLLELLRLANIVEVNTHLELCRDTTDNMLVDCAVSGRVQFLVSYDKDIVDDAELKRALFEFGVEVIEPPNFLKEIQKE